MLFETSASLQIQTTAGLSGVFLVEVASLACDSSLKHGILMQHTTVTPHALTQNTHLLLNGRSFMFNAMNAYANSSARAVGDGSKFLARTTFSQ